MALKAASRLWFYDNHKCRLCIKFMKRRTMNTMKNKGHKRLSNGIMLLLYLVRRWSLFLILSRDKMHCGHYHNDVQRDWSGWALWASEPVLTKLTTTKKPKILSTHNLPDAILAALALSRVWLFWNEQPAVWEESCSRPTVWKKKSWNSDRQDAPNKLRAVKWKVWELLFSICIQINELEVNLVESLWGRCPEHLGFFPHQVYQWIFDLFVQSFVALITAAQHEDICFRVACSLTG